MPATVASTVTAAVAPAMTTTAMAAAATFRGSIARG
jgi:hypothetical protein